MKHVAYFGSSALVTLALLGYAVFAHGERILAGDRYPIAERPAAAKVIADSCVRGAHGGAAISIEHRPRFCACYAGELVNIASVSDLKSIETSVTYRFQIRADRASELCRTKLDLAGR